MEYDAVNIAPEGKKQGDYYTTTIGPWDYWVVEYAYKSIGGSSPEAEIAGVTENRCPRRNARIDIRHGR